LDDVLDDDDDDDDDDDEVEGTPYIRKVATSQGIKYRHFQKRRRKKSCTHAHVYSPTLPSTC
jgi:hypothetical protein